MKKFVFALLSLLLLCKSTHAFTCIYHESSPKFRQNCEQICNALQIDNCQISDTTLLDWGGIIDDVVYINTHGSPDGILIADRQMSWQELKLKVKANILVLDVCYGGFFLLTLTPQDEYDLVVASGGFCLTQVEAFARTLVCLFCNTCCGAKDVVWCNQRFDFGLCYLYFTYQEIETPTVFGVIENQKQLPACVGGPLIWTKENGIQPLR